MSSFRNRLKDEISYQDIRLKELAAKANVPLKSLETYIGYREVMPAADVAVRLAYALGVTVEYLVTGEESNEFSKYLPLKKILDDLLVLPETTLETIYTMVHAAAELERKKQKKSSVG